MDWKLELTIKRWGLHLLRVATGLEKRVVGEKAPERGKLESMRVIWTRGRSRKETFRTRRGSP